MNRTPGKAMTLRLDATQAMLLESMARANGRSVAAEIREAVDAFVAARMANPPFAAEARRVADGWVRFADRCGEAQR